MNDGSPLRLGWKDTGKGKKYDAWVEWENNENLSSIVLAVGSDKWKICGVWKDGELMAARPFWVSSGEKVDLLHLPDELRSRDWQLEGGDEVSPRFRGDEPGAWGRGVGIKPVFTLVGASHVQEHRREPHPVHH